MRKKRVITKVTAVLLSFAVVFSMIPGVVFADAGVNEPIVVTTAEQFAAMDAGGNYKLGADITVTVPYANDFSGTFDGDGHTVTLNITADNSANQGLFKTLVGGATVSNIVCKGKIEQNNNKSCTGAVTGIANSYDGDINISNCKSEVTVSAYSNVGGIVGHVTGSKNTITVENCANTGAVSGRNNKVGGIIGIATGGHIVKNCYNRADIEGFNNVGGITGQATDSSSRHTVFSNCYSTGKVSIIEESTNTSAGALFGVIAMGKGEVSNCYALENTASGLIASGITGNNCAFKTLEQMKAADFAELLGKGFTAKAGDYPSLAWEIPTAKVRFSVSPSDARVTILKDGNIVYTSSEGDARTASLPAGEYTYSAEKEGYTEASGSFSVTKEQAEAGQTISGAVIALTKDAGLWSKVTFNISGSDSYKITVKDSEDNVWAGTGNEYELVKDKTYSYTVIPDEESVEGFSSQITVNSDITEKVTLKAVSDISIVNFPKREFYAGDKFDTDGLKIKVVYTDNTEKELIEGFTVAGFDSSQESESQTVTISYKGKSATYTVTIKAKPFPSTVFNALAGKAAIEYSHSGSFKGTAGEEFIDDEANNALKSNSAGVGNSQVTVKIKFNENLKTSKFKFLYKVSSEISSYSGSVYDGLQINGESKIGGEVDWTEKELTVQGGDEVTLTYVKDSSGDKGSDCVWLRSFALEELHSAEFNLNPADADISLTEQNDTNVVEPSSSDSGKVVFSLENGTYAYTVSKFGYVAQTGTITVADKDISKDIALVMSPMKEISFNITLPDNVSADSEVTVKSGGRVITAEADGKYKLPAGEYTYTITNPYCETETGKFTVGDTDNVIEKTLTRKLVFSDFFDSLDGITAKNDSTYPYEAVKNNSEGNYLRSSAAMKNYGKASIMLTATKNIRLSFDYLGSNSSSSYYPFTVKKGSKTLLTSYDKTAWEKFGTILKKDESLALTFEKPYSYGSYDYCVKLKNFSAVPIHSVKIISETEGADIVLKDDKNNTVTSVEGEYLLADGIYTYTASKFGYETATGNITVASEDKVINIGSLTALDVRKINFNINVNDAEITVKHSSGIKIIPENGVYLLPEGEYSYSVIKEGYITVTGSFTASEDKTIDINLVSAGEAWDGTSKNEPAQQNGVYQISNAAEFAWFADKVNDGNEDISAILTANINLNGKTWKGFGTYDYSDETKGFSGTLDGNWKTISGLKGKNGIVDCLSVNGIIKNLYVDGNVSGTANVGGIANTSRGTIENCVFSGSVSNSSNSGSTAGIAGRALAGNKVKNCVNKAAVANTTSSYASTLNVGGIVGYTYGTVENCYSVGKISTKEDRTTNKAIGGIAGQVYASAVIANSYSAGKVTGPKAGIGAVAGVVKGTFKNVYYDSSVCDNAVAEGVSTAQAKTADEMKEESFVSEMDPFDEHFNSDSDMINSGYPVLKWQGGTPVEVPALLKELLKAKDNLVLKQSYVKTDTPENEKTYFSMLAEQNGEKEWNIDTICDHIEAGILVYNGVKVTEDKLDWYLDSIYEDYYKWLAAEEEKEIKAEADGTYIIESDRSLILDSEAEEGINILWSSSNAGIIAADGKVTLPENGAADVVLTAQLSKDGALVSKEFSIKVKSDKSKSLEMLEEIKEKLEKPRAFIQPFEIYNHTNVREAMEFYLNQNGYDIDENNITVSFVKNGEKTYPATDNTVNISDDGTLSYFTGSGYSADNYANYKNVEFRLERDGQSVDIKTNVHIGWSFKKVEEMTDAAIAKVTWDAIKGNNDNTSSLSDAGGWKTVTVDGQVSENLNLPTKDSEKPLIKIQWSSRKDTDAIAISENADGSYTGKLKRPRYNSEPRIISIKAEAYFDGFDEETKAQLESPSGNSLGISSVKMFTMTIAPETEDISMQLQKNLEEKYEGLIRDFVDKNAEVNTSEVSKDLQMPRPAVLTEAGIMDRDVMKVKMESGNTDVLDFYGYHAQLYRPLPGESDVTVPYTIRIVDYYNESDIYAEKTFYLKVKALTQKEIDDAKVFMSKALTEEAYWNGIKGNNTDKNSVTSDLNPFVEILQDENGELKYVRGTANITFAGIDVDDLDGWYLTEKFREFKSSKPGVVSHELLRITPPEYNTKVKIQSVLTHSEFGKYWNKFCNTSKASKYAEFKQFYMQPVSTEITVTGTKGIENPEPEISSVKATVTVSGKNAKGFKDLSSITVYDLDADNATAWDAVSYALLSNGYKYKAVGSYIASITDPAGVTLSDEDTTDSGWLYTVNGKLPNVYMASYDIKNNDNIELYYTGNWKEDPNAGSWNESKKEVITTGNTGSAITTVPTEVKISGNTAAATVTDENAAELIKQAKENKSVEIVINVSSSDTKDAETVNLELDKKTVESIVKDTEATVTVKTPAGEINLDKETLKQIAGEAEGNKISIEITKVSKPEEAQKSLVGANGQVFKLAVKSGNKVISDFTGTVTVRLAVPAALKDKNIAAVHIKDGALEKLEGRRITQNNVEFYEFKTPHFSGFALVDTAEVKLDSDDKNDSADKAKSLIKELKLKAVSSKTAKKNVKVTVKMNSKNNTLIKELSDMGYTVKYRYYRSVKKASKYTAVKTKTSKTYINTKGKRGSKYYYKVRAVVYDGDKVIAQSALKQCKYAVRTWSK